MEDVLELAVEDNEFENEPTIECQNLDRLGGKTSELINTKSSCASNPKDCLTLYEAKKKLLESLAELEERNDTTLGARPSVKSRLGVRKIVEDVEFMDCTDSESNNGVDSLCERGETDGRKPMGDGEYGKNRNTKEEEDIPLRTSFKTLCQRLRVKWHDSPEKIGKEIAERLQENKHCLIINVVKIIGGKKAIELFNETKCVQLEGGMKIRNGSRRRTSGGVFLNLLKTKNYATAEEIKTIFKQDTKIKNEIMKRKRALQRQQQHEKTKRLKMMVDATVVESQNNTTEQELTE